MSGFAIVVALMVGLIGAATNGREMRSLTEQELRQTTAGVTYSYCSSKTGGFLPDTGCGKCKAYGVVEVIYELLDADGNFVGWFSVWQSVWQTCVNNAGDDACYQDDYPMEAGSTPTCIKDLVNCGGDGTWFAGDGCTDQISNATVSDSPDLGPYCRSQRSKATNGTATGVSCVGTPFGVY